MGFALHSPFPHMKRSKEKRLTSKEVFAFTSAFNQCEWVLNLKFRHHFRSVTKTVFIGYDLLGVSSMVLRNDDTVVICGYSRNASHLKCYNVLTEAELNCMDINDAYGLAEVKINGKTILAVSQCR